MFANNHHSMVGGAEDPKDGAKVATAVFGAVVVYAVSDVHPWSYVYTRNKRMGVDVDVAIWTLRGAEANDIPSRSSSSSAAAKPLCINDKAHEARSRYDEWRL